MDRRGLFLKHIADVGRVGVEIGALNRPAVTRDDADVRYLDHVDTAGLRRKYHDDPAVDVSQIVDVDHVWQGEPLSTVIGDDARLDFFVASHVIEHVPNLIGWLNEVHGVLRPGGRLLLIVPDKRFTFDARRRCTELTDVIEDYLEDRRRPSCRHIFGQLSKRRRSTPPPSGATRADRRPSCRATARWQRWEHAGTPRRPAPTTTSIAASSRRSRSSICCAN